mmetsp:Transcript_35680/g.83932  ORF Transcript_35680/g.83932 Transcript_35680/m.83932 type:complete len:172 (-) Transcript_35680:222-737(-)
MYQRCEQKGSAEAFVETYSNLVSRINDNEHSAKLHTDASLILWFVQKLKPAVQAFLLDKTFTTLEEAYSDAIRWDNLVYANSRAQGTAASNNCTPKSYSSKFGCNRPGPLGASRASSPSPALPVQVIAALSALSMSWMGRRSKRSRLTLQPRHCRRVQLPARQPTLSPSLR